MLDIVHGKHRGPAAVEVPQYRSGSVDNVRFAIHERSDVFKNQIVREFMESLAARQRCGLANLAPQREQAVANHRNLETIAVSKWLEEALILLGDK